jgi:hypothetical protein
MNRTSRTDWTAWSVGADDETKTAVGNVWNIIGPPTLVDDAPLPHCDRCGGHNWGRYGVDGRSTCPGCRGESGLT